jgi:fatty acid desaturase
VAFFLAFGSVLGWQRHLPWPIEVVALTLLGGLWMSLGHELLHGHPTRWNAVNTAIGFLPLSLWIPFARYKATHIQHHHCDLTDPFDDPESSYTDPAVWAAAGRAKRAYLTFLRTAVGRFTIGVPRTVLRYWASDARRFTAEPTIAVQWIVHLAAALVLGWLLFGVWHVPVLTYVFGFVLGGVACTMLRSFAEHRAVTEGSRSAVVTAGPAMSLLFLNNNLHHAHHARPNLPWYEMPRVARELHSTDAAANGAGLYRSYLEVLRRYAVTPFDRAEHPLTAGLER